MWRIACEMWGESYAAAAVSISIRIYIFVWSCIYEAIDSFWKIFPVVRKGFSNLSEWELQISARCGQVPAELF